MRETFENLMESHKSAIKECIDNDEIEVAEVVILHLDQLREIYNFKTKYGEWK